MMFIWVEFVWLRGKKYYEKRGKFYKKNNINANLKEKLYILNRINKMFYLMLCELKINFFQKLERFTTINILLIWAK